MGELERLISWYLNTSDPGVAADYLEELVAETNDANYEEIIETLKTTDGYSVLSLLLYVDEIATPSRQGLLPHVDELEQIMGTSSYGPCVARIRSRITDASRLDRSD